MPGCATESACNCGGVIVCNGTARVQRAWCEMNSISPGEVRIAVVGRLHRLARDAPNRSILTKPQPVKLSFSIVFHWLYFNTKHLY